MNLYQRLRLCLARCPVVLSEDAQMLYDMGFRSLWPHEFVLLRLATVISIRSLATMTIRPKIPSNLSPSSFITYRKGFICAAQPPGISTCSGAISTFRWG